MTDDNGNKSSPSHAEILRAQREARLAAEMRANLLKRKALKRNRAAGETADGAEPQETTGEITPD